MKMSFRLIDPDSKLDFSADWSDWLDSGVLITGTPVWTINPTGPTLDGQVDITTKSTIFVSGCTSGVIYELSCKITTDAATAQIAERSITLRCEQR